MNTVQPQLRRRAKQAHTPHHVVLSERLIQPLPSRAQPPLLFSSPFKPALLVRASVHTASLCVRKTDPYQWGGHDNICSYASRDNSNQISCSRQRPRARNLTTGRSAVLRGGGMWPCVFVYRGTKGLFLPESWLRATSEVVQFRGPCPAGDLESLSLLGLPWLSVLACHGLGPLCFPAGNLTSGREGRRLTNSLKRRPVEGQHQFAMPFGVFERKVFFWGCPSPPIRFPSGGFCCTVTQTTCKYSDTWDF